MKTSNSPLIGGANRLTARSFLGLLFVTFLFASPQPVGAQAKNFLWKVRSEQNSIYILGSIHFLKKENYPLAKSILEALDGSKKLVLEIDLNSASPEAAERVTLEKAVYRDGTSLRQNIGPETYGLTEQRAKDLGVDIELMRPLKPWFVALTLMSIKLQKIGLDSTYGVDRYLAARAKVSEKPTRGLETLEFQVGLLDQLSRRDQEMMLRETVEELDLLDKNVDQIVRAWAAGDSQSMEKLLLAGMKEYPDLYQRIIAERNRRWLPEIEKMIAQGDGSMVVVGAAHLVGKDGVIELLKARGYTVEQM